MRYRIGAPIGRGGMAEVLEAWRLLPNGKELPVAIKRLLPAHDDNPDALMHFEREALIGLTLSCAHPNLVSVLDFERSKKGALYIVMERVDGVSLDRLMGTDVLPAPVVRAVLRDIAGALGYIHSHGVVHRDIAPRNVLVDRTGVVKLLDFGLGRWLDGPRSYLGFKGTPAFASFEAIQDWEPGPGMDLYSMAAVGYHLLTGTPPYGFGHFMQINRRMSIRSVAPLPDHVPADLADAIMALLQPPGERRIHSAEEFLGLLGEPCASAETLASWVKTAPDRAPNAMIEARSRHGEPLRPVDVAPARPQSARPWRARLALVGLLGGLVLGYVLLSRDAAPRSQGPAPHDDAIMETVGPDSDPSSVAVCQPDDATMARLHPPVRATDKRAAQRTEPSVIDEAPSPVVATSGHEDRAAHPAPSRPRARRTARPRKRALLPSQQHTEIHVVPKADIYQRFLESE